MKGRLAIAKAAYPAVAVDGRELRFYDGQSANSGFWLALVFRQIPAATELGSLDSGPANQGERSTQI